MPDNNEVLSRIRESGILNPNATLEEVIRASSIHANNPGGDVAWELVTKDFALRGMPQIENIISRPER
ncbi:hypothetical protein [Bacillus thuringiensis]|uniref:hypothetical protein n=1 Tax=Bacillus thuringiensis TaxID=1428 RepID=UPI000BFE26CC|nr:hypothetical protein [Bacillus thuringiensis]PGU19075.1 hypothetical protein COD23_08580 [Bacillus thuringiensis]